MAAKKPMQVDKRVLQKLRKQIKREQASGRRDTIRVDPELDEAIEAYVSELNKADPTVRMDRGKLWRTAAREYLGIAPKANAGVQYVPIEELMPA
jgi:hypothetical protein